MELKPYQAGYYSDNLICISNPANGKQELFSEREYEIVKFLKHNEQQTLLALLLPNIGIAKKSHIKMCLSVLGKLKRIQIVDELSMTGRRPSFGSGRIEVMPGKSKIEFTSLNALAATIVGIVSKVLAPFGQAGILFGTVVFAALSFALFPFDAVDSAIKSSSFSYPKLVLFGYATACASFCLRSLAQAGFLGSFNREIQEPSIAFSFPFLSLSGNTSPVNLLGYRARAQMAFLGVLSPLGFSFLFTLLALTHKLEPVMAYVGFASSVGMSLFLLCPFLHYDGSSLIQALFFREELEEKTSAKLRELFRFRRVLEREDVFSIFLAVAWLFTWLDSLRAFSEVFSKRLAEDLSQDQTALRLGAAAAVAILVALIVFPLVLCIVQSRGKKNKHTMAAGDRVSDNMSLGERIAALEKIPLFAYLNDQERVSLQNMMQPAFFRDGDFLVRQGEVGREFFVLVKGSAIARHMGKDGKNTTLSALTGGDAFGEIALIDDVPRTVSIISEGGCFALILRKDAFVKFAESLGSPDRVKALVRLTSFFRRHPLFSKLSARDQAQLIDSFHFQTITSGEHIPDGDDRFHVVYSGSVRVDTGGADGETTLKSDDCFGYANPLRARFIAMEGTGLLVASKTEFHSLIWEKLVARPELFV